MMKRIWPILVLALFGVFFFYRFFLLGEVFFFGDNISLILPTLKFWANSLKSGHWPLWNPDIFSGVPFLPEIALGVFNPLSLLFLFLSPFKSLSWEIVLEIFLAGIFCFWYLRSVSRSCLEAILGAVVYSFSASLLTFINNISLLSTAYLLPLVILAGRKVLVSEKRLRWLAILALVMTWQFASGHPQITYYTFSLLFLYFLFFPGISWRQKLGRGILISAIFLLLSAFIWRPFLEAISFSTRPGNNFEYVTSWSLHPFLLLRFFLPGFFGEAVKGFSWGPAYRLVADNTGYFGILVILIMIWGWFGRRKSFEMKFFTWSLFLSIILAMGRYTPLFSLFYRFFPGFRFFRSPTQILMLTNFSAAVLVSGIWPSFLAKLKEKKIIFFVKKVILFLSGLNLICLAAFFKKENFFVTFYALMGKIYFLLKNRPLVTSAFHRLETDRVIFNQVINQVSLAFLLILAFFSVIFLYQRKRLGKNIFSALILVLVFLDLFTFNRNNYFSVKANLLEDGSEAAKFLQNQEGHWRYISSAGYWPFTGLNVYWENVSFRPPFADSVYTMKEEKTLGILKDRLRTLPPNWGMVYGLATPMGYGDLILKDYAQFLSQKTGRINVNEVDSLALEDPRLNLLGVKYFLVDSSFAPTVAEIESYPQYVLVKEIGNVRIYENKKVLGRVFLEKEGEAVGKAEILEYGLNEVKIETKADEQSTLVLTDTFYPGWEVFVDSQEKEIKSYQNVFRSVELEPGEHQVEFKFRPKSFYSGLKLGIVGILVVVLVCFL